MNNIHIKINRDKNNTARAVFRLFKLYSNAVALKLNITYKKFNVENNNFVVKTGTVYIIGKNAKLRNSSSNYSYLFNNENVNISTDDFYFQSDDAYLASCIFIGNYMEEKEREVCTDIEDIDADYEIEFLYNCTSYETKLVSITNASSVIKILNEYGAGRSEFKSIINCSYISNFYNINKQDVYIKIKREKNTSIEVIFAGQEAIKTIKGIYSDTFYVNNIYNIESKINKEYIYLYIENSNYGFLYVNTNSDYTILYKKPSDYDTSDEFTYKYPILYGINNSAYLLMFINNNKNGYVSIDKIKDYCSTLTYSSDNNKNKILYYEYSSKSLVFKFSDTETFYVALDTIKTRIGSTDERPSLTSDNAGFVYYDTTLKKKILWNGTDWVNLDGSLLDVKKSGTTEERPANVEIGFIYKDTTLNKLILWEGTKWINLDGTELAQ